MLAEICTSEEQCEENNLAPANSAAVRRFIEEDMAGVVYGESRASFSIHLQTFVYVCQC